MARERFEAVLEQASSPDALLGLASALWWLGETEASVRYLERPMRRFAADRIPPRPSSPPSTCVLTYLASLGNYAAARGWAARAVRLVDEFELGPLEGWVLLVGQRSLRRRAIRSLQSGWLGRRTLPRALRAMEISSFVR